MDYKGISRYISNKRICFYLDVIREDNILTQTYNIEKSLFKFAKDLDFQSYKERLLDSSIGVALIKCYNQEVIGYFVLDKINENIYFVSIIAVKKQYRNKKIGTFLMEVLLRIFNDMGGKTLYLTIPLHSGLKNFYESFKFIEFSRLNVNSYFNNDIKRLQDFLSRQVEKENVNLSLQNINPKRGIIKNMYGKDDGIILVFNN